MKLDISLYVLVDPAIAKGKPLDQLAAAAAKGGATLVQLRDKTGTTRRSIDEARAIKHALRGTGVPLIINDRADVALAVDAGGIHVGRDDLDPRDARRLLGPRAIIGVSVKSEADIEALPIGAVDYACIGGVFATTSKDNPDRPIGLDGFRRLHARLRARAPQLPIGAIAGINETNAAAVIGAGAEGIAVISAVIAAADAEAAARRLRALVDGARSKSETAA
ncbi:MAG TPA: thiamine phosphate synthase [Xanthobacteraceae bacterium]|nr:thiamine phosphate synthase [Xanthobacteraceae bacterium]